MHCTNCGKELRPQAHFCTECGSRVGSPTPTAPVHEKQSGGKKLVLWIFGPLFLVVLVTSKTPTVGMLEAVGGSIGVTGLLWFIFGMVSPGKALPFSDPSHWRVAGVAFLVMTLGAFIKIADPEYRARKAAKTEEGQAAESAADAVRKVRRAREATGARRITGNTWFGCQDRSSFSRVSRYFHQKDFIAYRKALAVGQRTGDCTTFKNGEEVFLADTAILSGLVKLRRKGEVVEYWTNIEATKQ